MSECVKNMSLHHRHKDHFLPVYAVNKSNVRPLKDYIVLKGMRRTR